MERGASLGGPENGTIATDGSYTAPAQSSSKTITISYGDLSQVASAKVTVFNPVPIATALLPTSITTNDATVIVIGDDFIPGSTVLVMGQPVPTQYQDSSHLSATVSASNTMGSSLEVQVLNPDPGQAISNPRYLAVNIPQMVITPQSLPVGDISLTVTLPGVALGSQIRLNGQVLTTQTVVGDVVSASGFLVPWASDTVPISVTGPDGSTVIASGSVPVAPTAASFDAAARFATQAAWGPRPDVVLHIQQVGFQQFINEQLQQPVGSFNVQATNPIRSYFLDTAGGNSLLRLRVASAFQSFMPGQLPFQNNTLAVPWELTLERDAFTNFRQILLDAASDPNIGMMLNLPGNVAPTDPSLHPNQNFARESMQLFSMGTVLLNEDGTPQIDSMGATIPAYDESTIIDMSRVYTGWNFGVASNPSYTEWGLDFNQLLVANESQHDHGSKVLFGSVNIPAGQTAAQDRDSAINAIMNHQNVAPFVSRILIQRLVKSQPSPSYIKRISSVFEDDGSGVKGNLAAVVSAILLDPEARAGDLQPDPSGGFVQDPIYAQTFMMGILGILHEDDQSTYIPQALGEGLWNSGSVFGFYSPDNTIPGTQTISPEFHLLSNFTITQRSQLMWSVASFQQPGFNNGRYGWLYSHFTTLPAMLDALNHLLYHGAMPQLEQTAILDYCGSLPDPQLQLESAVFLTLNSDSYTVSH